MLGEAQGRHCRSCRGANRFREGEGIWLISQTEWTVQDTLEAVPLDADGQAHIPLRDGWNVIVNPLGRDLPWSMVQEASDLSAPLWSWQGRYQETQTFESAVSGQAYYLFNKSGRGDLVLPYEAATGGTGSAKSSSSDAEETTRTFDLAAFVDGREASSVELGTVEEGPQDSPQGWAAPPGHFAAARLVAQNEVYSYPLKRLLKEGNPATEGSVQYRLHLHAEPGQSVTVRPRGLEAFSESEAVLIEESSGRRHGLREGKPVALEGTGEPLVLTVQVGAPAEVGPDDVALEPPYPNPVRRRATIEYALPDRLPVKIEVYDALGRRVAVLRNTPRESPGYHSVTWEAEADRTLASGVYFIRLRAGDKTRTQKVTIVR